MDIHKLRAWWWQRQGLDGSLKGKSAAEVLEGSKGIKDEVKRALEARMNAHSRG